MQSIHDAFDRVRKNIEINERGCWIWLGALAKDAYGQIKVDGKTWATHRIAFAALHGEIPRGKVIRHQCDESRCCNPAHLLIGDHEDNVQDILDRGRARRRILTAAELGTLRELRAAGRTKREICEALSCSWYIVSRAIDEVGVDVPRVGRPKGSRNVHVRVTEEMKTDIRSLYATGKHTQSALAERFGCDQTYISLIVKKF